METQIEAGAQRDHESSSDTEASLISVQGEQETQPSTIDASSSNIGDEIGSFEEFSHSSNPTKKSRALRRAIL